MHDTKPEIHIPLWPARPQRIWPGGNVYRDLLGNANWTAEPKLDGWRCLIEAIGDAEVRAWTRHGKLLPLSVEEHAAWRQMDLCKGIVLDGELMGPRHAGRRRRFVAFDVPSLHGLVYEHRRFFLEQMACWESLEIVPQLPPSAESFIQAVADGREGLVFKRRDAVYPYALGPNTSETTAWLKLKAATQDGRVL